MDHLFHPWHYWPLILALPYIGILAAAAKQRLTGEPNVRQAQDPSEDPQEQ